MTSLVNTVRALASPGPRKFEALVAAKRTNEAASLALRHIGMSNRKLFFFRKLFELYASVGDHRAILETFKTHAADKTLDAYAMQVVRATALIETGQHDAARAVLLQLIMEHNYVVPLQLYRRLPETPGGLDMVVAAFSRSRRSPATRAAQGGHLVDIATSANEIDRAHYMMLEILGWIGDAQFNSAPKARSFMKPSAGNAALVDLHDLLMPSAPFFLISGTLLGVIREGRLLGADKDIDVGVMGHETRDAIKRLVAGSSNFEEAFVPSVDFIKLTHSNGVKVDLFFHHQHAGMVWHGSHLHAWDNRVWWKEGASPLSKTRFANRDFLIPSDPDMYLTDNYGDWRTPQADYDASLEAPNRRIRNRVLVRLHWQKLIIKYYLGGELGLLSKAFHYYDEEFGVDEFLHEAARLLLMREIGRRPAARLGRGEILALPARR